MSVEMIQERNYFNTIFSNFNLAKIFILTLVLKILNGHLFDFLNNNYFKLEDAEIQELEKQNGFIILAVIVAPIVETLIFQLGLNELLIKLKVKSNFLLLFVPGVVFALSHSYNWLYVIFTFSGGLMLNWFYLYAKAHGKYAFWWTVLLHSFYNLYGSLV